MRNNVSVSHFKLFIFAVFFKYCTRYYIMPCVLILMQECFCNIVNKNEDKADAIYTKCSQEPIATYSHLSYLWLIIPLQRETEWDYLQTVLEGDDKKVKQICTKCFFVMYH